MPYTYERIVTIGGKDFTTRADSVSFSWAKNIGCDTASISIIGVPFDDTAGIELDDAVTISFSSGVPWWTGIVTDLRTTLTGKLAVTCAGLANTLLQERSAFGAYGSEVFLPYVTTLASAIVADGNIGEGFHKYLVTAHDEKGERVSSHATLWYLEEDGVPVPSYAAISIEEEVNFTTEANTALSIKLTWDDDERVHHWRVYKQFTTAQAAAAVGSGSVGTQSNVLPTAADKLYYIEVTSPEFTDDGTIDWVNEGTEIEMPIYDTCRVPAISSTGAPYSGGVGNVSVRAAVRHLILTAYNEAYNVDKLSYGEDIELDDVDFDQDEASLAEALETLAKYCGNAVYGMDQAGDVYFRERLNPEKNSSVTSTFKVGAVRNFRNISAGSDTDVLLDISKTLTRDGATDVQVATNDESAARVQAARQLPDEYPDDFPKRPKRDKTRKPNVLRVHLTENSPTLPDTAAELFADYATSDDFEDAFPGMAALWRIKDSTLGGASAWRDSFVQTLKGWFHPGYNRYGGRRRRGITCMFPGLRTEQAIIRSAASVAEEHTPVVGKWTLTLINGTTLYIPGESIVDVHTLAGIRYRLGVHAVSYDFADQAKITLECGEPDIYEIEERHRKKVITKLAAQNPIEFPPAGSGNPVTRYMRRKPTQNKRINAQLTGVYNEAASIDHAHSYDAETHNRVLTKDGSHHPYTRRGFNIAAYTDIAKLTDSAQAEYIRGLQYKPGDTFIIEGTEETEKMTRRIMTPAAQNSGVAIYGSARLIEVFEVLDEFEDCLRCRCVDTSRTAIVKGTTGSIYVAKPYQLRQTPFDGETIAYFRAPTAVAYTYTGIGVRTASVTDGPSERQVIVPAYQSGEHLHAVYANTGLVDPDGSKQIVWCDMNLAGRAWAYEEAV